ncbi:hypothetical protein F5Y16DRAFT_53527 [Xylariaceae sp. FL0255]|nr:hypothetical protein F5Y16DRAFT_53527 [Xylariaceae sp. FL0255]
MHSSTSLRALLALALALSTSTANAALIKTPQTTSIVSSGPISTPTGVFHPPPHHHPPLHHCPHGKGNCSHHTCSCISHPHSSYAPYPSSSHPNSNHSLPHHHHLLPPHGRPPHHSNSYSSGLGAATATVTPTESHDPPTRPTSGSASSTITPAPSVSGGNFFQLNNDDEKFVQTTYYSCVTFSHTYTHCGWHEPILDAGAADCFNARGVAVRAGLVAGVVGGLVMGL